MDYLAIGKLTLYYLLYPIYLVLNWVAVILLAISVPVMHLGRYLLDSCLWLVRLLARFEVITH